MTVKSVFIFAAGATVGAICSWYATKRVTETRCYNEYRADISEKNNAAAVTEPEMADEATASDKTSKYTPTVTSAELMAARNEATRVTVSAGYIEKPEQTPLKPGEIFNKKSNNRPYLISANEFAEESDYDSVEIEWYETGKFATFVDGGAKVEDVNNIIGISNLAIIASTGDTYGYVRDDSVKRDYVIHVNYDPDETPIFVDED